jgi:hypothetical protein
MLKHMVNQVRSIAVPCQIALGESWATTEYWLSSLKIVTILVFIFVGCLVNLEVNRSHTLISFKNWTIPGAPFVGGFGGFARVFVTASFACELSHGILAISLLMGIGLRWRDGKFGYYGWRDQKSFPEHPDSCQARLLAVNHNFLAFCSSPHPQRLGFCCSMF